MSVTRSGCSGTTSQFQDKVQRAPARRIFDYSERWVSFGYDWLGDSQAHAVPFVGFDLRRVRCDARLAFLAHVGLPPLRRTSCNSGFRGRVGYAPRHDHRLVDESNAAEGHG